MIHLVKTHAALLSIEFVWLKIVIIFGLSILIGQIWFLFDLVYLHLNSQSEASQQEKISQLFKIQKRFPTIRTGKSKKL